MFLKAWIVLLGIIYAECKSLNDTKVLLRHLLSDYEKSARPVLNQDDVIDVYVTIYLKAIQEFDEVRERFSYTAGFLIQWKDEAMVWDRYLYGGVGRISIPYNKVWVPDMTLSNPSKEIKPLGQDWQSVRYRQDGNAQWIAASLVETTCEVNARNYPFDTQVCTSSFKLIGMASTLVIISPRSNTVVLDEYSENSGWAIQKTAVERKYKNDRLEVNFYLKRKPAFVITNVLLPIVFLGLLNVLVFLLVPQSGERMSFCITVLLSIAVFLTIVSDTLPQCSEPVPIISYKLMADMLISSLITVATILNLRVVNKGENEIKPRWVMGLYRCLYCDRSMSHVNRAVTTETEQSTVHHNDNKEMDADMAVIYPGKSDKDLSANQARGTCESSITWTDISSMIDIILFFVFASATLINFTVFIILTYVKIE